MTPLIPALLTTTSSRPNVSAARATAVLTCAELVTSATVQIAASPSSEAPARSSSSTRPTRQTRAPSAAKVRAVAMPMLPSPPVMMAALPRSRPLESMPPMLMRSAAARLARQRTPLDRESTAVPRSQHFARPVVPRADPVGRLEQPAEMSRVRVAPAGAYGRHRPAGPARVTQIVPAALEPALPDPAGHGGAAGVEEFVQPAQRDVMGRRDLRRGQVGLAQVLLDERGDLEHQSPVRPVRVPRRTVEPFGQYRAEQVQHVARQPHPNP